MIHLDTAHFSWGRGRGETAKELDGGFSVRTVRLSQADLPWEANQGCHPKGLPQGEMTDYLSDCTSGGSFGIIPECDPAMANIETSNP